LASVGVTLFSHMQISSRKSPRASLRAFTLLEILVVLAIIGLLVGLAVTNLDRLFGKNQGEVARLFVNSSMKVPLMTYRIDMGGYPTTAEGLQALVSAPANRADSWKGPYLEKLPLDPWQEPYIYRYPGVKNKDGYDLFSKGADKAEGSADDIGNW
jgi:general secretion pathway protein G